MRKDRFVIGLDIGTTKVCALVGEKVGKDDGWIAIRGMGMVPARGVCKGVITDPESIISPISSVLREAEATAGVRINKIVASLVGGQMSGVNSKGIVALSRRGAEVRSIDVERVVEAASAVAIPLEREVIHILPLEFIVDGQQSVEDPVGIIAVRLEAEVHLITADIDATRKVLGCINQAGYEVETVVFPPLAASEAVLTEEEKQRGVVLFDIGGGTVDVVIFLHGGVHYSNTLPLGGNHLTGDLAIGLSSPVSRAEELKKAHGYIGSKPVSREELINISTSPSVPAVEVSRDLVCKILRMRAREILSLAYREVEQSGALDLLAAGIVITGGVSLTDGLVELAEEVFQLPVRVGQPDSYARGLEGINDTAIYATGVGLVSYGLNNHHLRRYECLTFGNPVRRLTNKVRRLLSDFF